MIAARPKRWSLKKAHRIGELSAAVAVVISLIFVGYEIQRNNEIGIETATQAVVRDYVSAIRGIANDSEVACLYARGIQDYLGLPGSERVRLSAFMLSVFFALQDMHLLMQRERLDPGVWQGAEALMSEVMQLQGAQQWFATRRHWFGNEFQAYVDDIIVEGSSFEPIVYDDPGCSSRSTTEVGDR